MRKKKRSAAQLRNDRRLGRMAKARAKAKRGGRRKARKRKNPGGQNPPRRTAGRRKIKRVIKKAKRRAVGGRWFQIFKCKGASVHFLALTTAGKLRWTLTRGDTVRWSSKSEAMKIARRLAKLRNLAGFYVGVASATTSTSSIVTQCKGGKV